MAGYLSGPGDALLLSSSIAFSRSGGARLMSDIVWLGVLVGSGCVLLGLVHTLAYCSDKMSAIFLGKLTGSELGPVRGPIPWRTFENVFA